MKNYERDDVRAFVIGEMWDDLRRLGFSGFLNDLGDIVRELLEQLGPPLGDT